MSLRCRWVPQREWNDQHRTVAGRPRRDGAMGARDIRKRIRRHELVQGEANETRKRDGDGSQTYKTRYVSHYSPDIVLNPNISRCLFSSHQATTSYIRQSQGVRAG